MEPGTQINVQPDEVKRICGTVSSLAVQALAVSGVLSSPARPSAWIFGR